MKSLSTSVLPVLFFLSAFFSCTTNNSAIKPEKKDLMQVVYASGKIYPYHHVHIAAKVNGYISRILVKTGDVVQEGTPLIILSAPNSDVDIDIAKTNLELSETSNRSDINQLNAAMQDVQSAYAKYQLDSMNYKRYQNLWKENISTKLALDQAKTTATISHQAYRRALSNYNDLKTRNAANVNLAKQELALQENSKSDFIITAPFDGKIYEIPVKEGQLLITGTPALDFGNANKFEAELDVDESDIGMIYLNQPVILSTDAYPDHAIKTIIREIEPSVVSGNKTTTVKADIRPDTLMLYNGMSVEANIIVNKKQQVLSIPREYLTSDNSVILKKGKTKMLVHTGISDEKYVEIISGIDSNTELLKPQ